MCVFFGHFSYHICSTHYIFLRKKSPRQLKSNFRVLAQTSIYGPVMACLVKTTFYWTCDTAPTVATTYLFYLFNYNLHFCLKRKKLTKEVKFNWFNFHHFLMSYHDPLRCRKPGPESLVNRITYELLETVAVVWPLPHLRQEVRHNVRQ